MKHIDNEVMTGTTIMAITSKTSIIIGADTRTSSGIYIPSRYTNKLTKLSKKIYCCRSGSAADTNVIADIVSAKLKEYHYKYDIKPSVKLAATFCQEMIYKNPTLLAGIIVAGFDDDGPALYSITLGGTMAKRKIALGGSGSIFIYGHCDAVFKEGFNDDEGLEFVKKNVSLAIKRDNFSGGCVRMAVINSEGIEKYFVPGNEIQ